MAKTDAFVSDDPIHSYIAANTNNNCLHIFTVRKLFWIFNLLC